MGIQWATHDASKWATPVRFVSLLPCPVDQFSSTLKSVHWYFSAARLSEQPSRQTSWPLTSSRVAAATVSASHVPPCFDSLSHVRRYVIRTYTDAKFNNTLLWYIVTYTAYTVYDVQYMKCYIVTYIHSIIIQYMMYTVYEMVYCNLHSIYSIWCTVYEMVYCNLHSICSIWCTVYEMVYCNLHGTFSLIKSCIT